MQKDTSFQKLKQQQKFLPNFKHQFQKGNLLGKGSVATGGVYEYINVDQNESYAVKIYSEKITKDISHIINEIQILNKIEQSVRCDNIIRFYGFYFESDAQFIEIYLVLDKADGSLKDLWNQQKNTNIHFTFSQVIEITSQLIQTFAELEGRGLTHRDMKMDNILYLNEINIKLTDFSEGRILLDNESNLDTLAGNQYHLAPELYYAYKQGQYSDIKYSSFKNDVYGLGVLLFDLCLLESRKNRELEGKINPIEVETGPYDKEWVQKSQKIVSIYEKNNEGKKEKIEDYSKFLLQMVQFSPKNRPRFYQLFYMWMDIQPLRIVNITYEYEFIDKLEEKDREIQKLRQLLLLQSASSDTKIQQSQDSQQNSENLNQIDQTESLSYIQENGQDTQKTINLLEQSTTQTTLQSTIPYKNALLQNENQQIPYWEIQNLSSENLNNSQLNDSQLHKYYDESGIVQIKTKYDVKNKLTPYKKKILVTDLNDEIVKGLKSLQAPYYIKLLLHGFRRGSNCPQVVSDILSTISPQLQSLQINLGCWENMKDKDVAMLCEGLLNLKQVKSLHLIIWEWGWNNKQVTDKSLQKIGETLQNLSELIDLKVGLERWGCENPQISDKGFEFLFKSLEKLNLYSLSLTLGSCSKKNNFVTNKSLQNLQTLLESQKNLRILKLVLSRWDCDNDKVSLKQLKELLFGICKSVTLKKLTIFLSGWVNISNNIKEMIKKKLESNQYELTLKF